MGAELGITPFGGREFVLVGCSVFLLGIELGLWLSREGWSNPALQVAGAVVALNVLTLRELIYEWLRRRADARWEVERETFMAKSWVAERHVRLPAQRGL